MYTRGALLLSPYPPVPIPSLPYSLLSYLPLPPPLPLTSVTLYRDKGHGCLSSFPPLFIFLGSCAPRTPRSGGRAMEPFPAYFVFSTSWGSILCTLFFFTVWESTSPGRYFIFSNT